MQMRGKRFSKLIFIMLFVVAVFFNNNVTAYAGSKTGSDTVILSSSDDLYYSLAEEISSTEGIEIFQTLEDAAEAKPVFLLWVIAPKNLTENVLMDFSKTLKNHCSTISVGIISGKDIEDARRVWTSAKPISNSDFIIVNGTKKNKINPEIVYNTGRQPLTKKNLLDAIQRAGIIQISMEGAAGSWFDKSLHITVKASDIPELDACMIQNYGCSTFRPWVDNSIALACLNKGAIAYCGFVYPSVTGTRFGDYTKISPLYSWDKFPLGHLVQIQNHAAMQSYADIPHYFMLGDPRIYCSSKIPYEVSRDDVGDETRRITLSGLPSGLIPICIKDGARFDYVSVSGLSSSSMDSKYFNRYLQMIDINNDKYLIIDNASNTVTIELQKEVPVLWSLTSNIVNFLDSMIMANQGSSLPIFLAILLLIPLLMGSVRKRYLKRDLIISFVLAGAIAFITLGYVFIREENIAVSNIPVSINWFFILSIFIFTGYGELLYVRAKKLKGKIIAVLTANLYTLVTFILLAGVMLIQLAVFGGTLGINKPGYPYVFALKELLAGCIFYSFLYGIYSKIIFRKPKQPSVF
jgi:hypothetical protein